MEVAELIRFSDIACFCYAIEGFLPSLPMWHCLCFLFGLWPRSAVALLFLVRRNANLAGGFAGRPVLVLFFFCVLFATAAFLYSLDTKSVLMSINWTYPNFRTEPLSL